MRNGSTCRGRHQRTTGHIGALLAYGTLYLSGGIVERADLMAHVPESFGSVTMTMTVLVVVLVAGMTMDPYGAVILFLPRLRSCLSKRNRRCSLLDGGIGGLRATVI